ncbi:hypothetical protein LEP1GSC036_2523 [Leptospira weilii str. 2006001853]|uniref:Uncharacterized protein n=2 Tax=Leptospira weilii TaxID=28184 RepID=A0A828YZI3_9LEPT|nr:hypothetical protein LEP1GSC036_2523 [Leptospira weilii str. 2006001853]EMM70414.1 hypothetical protein LEP1GSC038_1775 [Leptospira weilii str. 2006001855]EMN42726.1 hypothetical protein LEP1GSC086_1151 [Leptospira weilii str. LNT 1234]
MFDTLEYCLFLYIWIVQKEMEHLRNVRASYQLEFIPFVFVFFSWIYRFYIKKK